MDRTGLDRPSVDALSVAAALLAALAVAMGAFGAHVLEETGDARAVALVETASRYQLAHALAALSAAALRPARRAARLAFFAGAVLFPGSLYALALGLPRGVAVLAPVGAVCSSWAGSCSRSTSADRPREIARLPDRRARGRRAGRPAVGCARPSSPASRARRR